VDASDNADGYVQQMHDVHAAWVEAGSERAFVAAMAAKYKDGFDWREQLVGEPPSMPFTMGGQ
jgi:hypothetical protein